MKKIKDSSILYVEDDEIEREPIDAHKKFSGKKYYDTYTKELYHNKNVVNLSKNERSLLELFVKKHPAPVSYESINAKVYNNGNSKNAIKLLIGSLRNKIDKTSIINVSGFGYRLNMVNDQ